MVRVSGHDASVAELRERLPEAEWTEVGSGSASYGQNPDGPAAVVSSPRGRSPAIMVLSYELSPDELLAWAGSLRPANEERWTAEGGTIG